MAMRIAVGGIHIESCTFSPLLSRETDFRIARGQALLDHFPFLSAEKDVTLFPILYARAVPGGPVEMVFYRRFKQEFLAGLRACLPLDGVFLPLHGAVSVEGMQDAEGDFLAAIREVADQAAQTVLTHIVLIDPAQILAIAPVQRTIATLHQFSHRALPVAAATLATLLLLVAILTIRDARYTREYKLYRPSGGSREVRAQNARTSRKRDPLLWPRAALQSTWLAASIFLVPTLVVQARDLTGRLAIQTAYLKFALETLATRANLVLIVWSGTLFVLASIGLIITARLGEKQNRTYK